jgi:hypothetical protein
VDHPSSSNIFLDLDQTTAITDNQKIGSGSPSYDHHTSDEEEEEGMPY